MTQPNDKKEGLVDQAELHAAIRRACAVSFGVLDSNFLCKSISVLEPPKPFCVPETETVGNVVRALRDRKLGCVVVVNTAGAISGIFSERDCLLKIALDFPTLQNEPISKFMTRDPVTQEPGANIAFVLNLMSAGGFRHLPIVGPDGMPIGIVSVKDVVDFIVRSFTDDLLNLQTET